MIGVIAISILTGGAAAAILLLLGLGLGWSFLLGYVGGGMLTMILGAIWIAFSDRSDRRGSARSF
ncbi:MAG: hypothetical protein P3W94_004530 [Paracoccus sp. (in: a-proteobacteria)]|nr:hypothetical protein [Paracoccus sp. (in: a-proteobacteria)]